jgi:hypothetical protein
MMTSDGQLGTNKVRMIKFRKLQDIDKSSTMNGVPNTFGKENVSQKPEKTIDLCSCRFLM